MGRISPRVQFPKSVNLNGAGDFLALICGCRRVTLVVAFGFLPQILRWQGPTNGTLSFYECGYHGYSDPTHCNQIRLNVLHSGSGIAKRSSLRPKSHFLKRTQHLILYFLFFRFLATPLGLSISVSKQTFYKKVD